jgi:hypothetical protein
MMSSPRIDTLAADEKDATLCVAFELGKAKWLIGLLLSGESKEGMTPASMFCSDGAEPR